MIKPSKQSNKNGLSFYKSGKNIRWRIYRSGRVTHASTESYSSIAGAKKNLVSFLKSLGIIVSDYTPGMQTINAAVASFNAKK